MITLPKTKKEYDRLAKFVKDFRFMRCRVCEKEYRIRRANNHPPRTCSLKCNKIWHNLVNRDRQRRFREKRKGVNNG